MYNYEVLIKGGIVIDPSQGIHEEKDVAISRGKIVTVEKGLNAAEAEHAIDASGRIVTPGLVDFHVHVYDAVMPFCIEADSCCLPKGTTTVLDAGSAGHLNFPGFKKHIVDQCRTRVYAMLNIGSIGLMLYGTNLKPLLEDTRQVDLERTVETVKENKDTILGIKWHNTLGPRALIMARQAADLAQCKLMCENSAYFWLPVWHILNHLSKGDILTHTFQGGPSIGILDEDGKVRSEVFKAVKRGVLLDIGHGMASFCFDVAEKAMKQGLLPNIISTDLYSGNINGPVFDMPTTLSKFLLLGLSLEDVVLRATCAPVEAMGLSDNVGNLKEGSLGDASIFEMREGRFVYEDAMGKKRIGRRRLVTAAVVLGGEVIHDEG